MHLFLMCSDDVTLYTGNFFAHCSTHCRNVSIILQDLLDFLGFMSVLGVERRDCFLNGTLRMVNPLIRTDFTTTTTNTEFEIDKINTTALLITKLQELN